MSSVPSFTFRHSDALARWLAARGYLRITLEPTSLGHFYTRGALAGQEVTILIDTGAASTVADLNWLHENGVSTVATGRTGGGAGDALMPVHRVIGARLSIAGHELSSEPLLALDLSNVRATLAQRGVNAPQVVLGVDVFISRGAIIDYATNSLFLLNPAMMPTDS